MSVGSSVRTVVRGFVSRAAAAGLFAAFALLSATPAAAQRGVVIDNNATSCGGTCTSLGNVAISGTGNITIGENTFFAADSGTLYRALTGYTNINTANGQQRLDFISFYTYDRSVTPNGAGNIPDPNFQIQLLFGQNGALDISYAYQSPTSFFGGNRIPLGAKIGYSDGNGGGVTILNENGLLLGSNSYLGTFLDSTFNFAVRADGTVTPNIQARYAATAAVPEPATWAMMLLGFAAIGLQMRQRRALLGTAAC